MSASAKLSAMNVALRPPRMTQDEFFAWVETQEGRYEFDGFQPVAMPGGTRDHGQIAANILVALASRLDSSPCTALGSDAGIETVNDAVRYPDVVVTCTDSDGNVRKMIGSSSSTSTTQCRRSSAMSSSSRTASG